jgi:glycerol-3-phosphate O-acyltransferase
MPEKENIQVTPRGRVAFGLVKTIATWGYRHLSHPHVDADLEAVSRLKRERPQAVVVYVSTHKSLWETTGIPAVLYYGDLTVPYVVMGDNLVHGRFFTNLVRQIGGIVVPRPRNRAEMIASAVRYTDILGTHLKAGIDFMVFPEATRTNIARHGRTGDFFPATFEALLAYERKRAEAPETNARECWIVPCNVDYSNVREAENFVRTAEKSAQTLHIFDSLKMLANIRDVYISFGEPLRVADRLGSNRKELAALTRAKCLELVRVLPVNVAATAFTAVLENNQGPDSVPERIRETLLQLAPHAHRFTGFAPATPPEQIWEAARHSNPIFGAPDPERLPLYHLYRGYIGHYFPTPEPK